LKYKFWAVNAVVFVIALLLVLYAMSLERDARAEQARGAAQQQAALLKSWPQGQPLPRDPGLLVFTHGEAPIVGKAESTELTTANGWGNLPHDDRFGSNPWIGAHVIDLNSGERLAVLAQAPSLIQVFSQRALSYALVVGLLMLALMAVSQLLIRFL